MKYPDPWYIIPNITANEFILGMLELGTPVETLIVGAFNKETEVILKERQALIFDNQKILHGRKGSVGNRLLLRFWIKAFNRKDEAA